MLFHHSCHCLELGVLFTRSKKKKTLQHSALCDMKQ
jgi:hypothetical protein